MKQSRFSFHEGDVDFNRLPPSAPGKLFIGGLSHDTTDASLRNFFEKFGSLISAEVLRDHQTLNSRGFGFVTYANEDIAYQVVKAGLMRPFVVDGKPVEVKNAVPKENKSSFQEFDSNPYAWPAKLHHYRTSSVSTTSTASPDPQQYNFGRPLARANTMKSFLTPFAEEESFLFNDELNYGPAFPLNTTRNARAPTETSFPSVPLQRVYSMPAFASSSTPTNVIIPNKVFVGGLLYATGHESLRRYFEQFGEIESAEVIYNRDTKKSRGFGFVIFKTLEAVESVLLKQKNDRLVIDGKQIEVKLCKPRDDLGSDYGYDYPTPTRERDFSLHSAGEYKSEVDAVTDLLNDSSFFDDVTDANIYSNDSTPMAKMSRHSFSYNPDREFNAKAAWPGTAVRSRVGFDQYDNFCQNYGFASTLHTISETQNN